LFVSAFAVFFTLGAVFTSAQGIICGSTCGVGVCSNSEVACSGEGGAVV